jgi:hypothetical protein
VLARLIACLSANQHAPLLPQTSAQAQGRRLIIAGAYDQKVRRPEGSISELPTGPVVAPPSLVTTPSDLPATTDSQLLLDKTNMAELLCFTSDRLVHSRSTFPGEGFP